MNLLPVMPSSGPPEDLTAMWVGEVSIEDVDGATVDLVGGEGFNRARILVRAGGAPRGFVEPEVLTTAAGDAFVRSGELLGMAAKLPAADVVPSHDNPPISVVVCSRDRPEMLAVALGSILSISYPHFELVVVDNASRTAATRNLVDALGDDRVRYVSEPTPGLARARNTGARVARHGIVAFTDDDTVVDKLWLDGFAAGFARAPGVACVSGIVPSGEIRGYVQSYFARRVSWARSCSAQVFDMDAPPAGDRLFPFQVGVFGTGANFALNRTALFRLGGFDEALGAGSRTGGGEDIDMFVRVLAGGWKLAYEPSAIVWHRHRIEIAELRVQTRAYGRGLGAWLTKVVLDRALRRLFMSRVIAAARYARKLTAVEPEENEPDGASAGLGRHEFVALLSGPPAYLRARRSGAKATPLTLLDQSAA